MDGPVLLEFAGTVPGAGLNCSATRALGITYTLLGRSRALSTVFSRLCHVLELPGGLDMKGRLPCMRHADDSVHVPQRSFEQLVCQDARGIIEPEETMVSEDRAHAHQMRMEKAFVPKRRQARMRMD